MKGRGVTDFDRMERPRARKVQMREICPNPSPNELMFHTIKYLTACSDLEKRYQLSSLRIVLFSSRKTSDKETAPMCTSTIDKISLSSLFSRRTLCHEKTLFVQHEMESHQGTSTKRSFETHVSFFTFGKA